MVLTSVPCWAFGQCLTDGFGSLLCQEGKFWGFQAQGTSERNLGNRPYLFFSPLEHATSPSFYVWERGGPGRGSRYIRVKQWSASSLNKLQWFSSFNLKPLFGCFRENKCNALCHARGRPDFFGHYVLQKLWKYWVTLRANTKKKKHYPKTASITNLGLWSNNSTKDQISIIHKHLFLS